MKTASSNLLSTALFSRVPRILLANISSTSNAITQGGDVINALQNGRENLRFQQKPMQEGVTDNARINLHNMTGKQFQVERLKQ